MKESEMVIKPSDKLGKAVIEFSDVEKDGVKQIGLSVKMDPIPTCEEDYTPAQRAGLLIIEIFHQLMDPANNQNGESQPS